MNKLKNWLNGVIFHSGLHFPYAVDEIKTVVKFAEKRMHVFMEIEKLADEFFEEEFWDDKYKKKEGVE